MIIETAALISISTWLGNKILDKGFDDLYEKITAENFNEKFYKKVNSAAKRLQKDHPEAFGGNIEYLFKHEDVFQETLKLLFVDAKVNLSIIEEKFDSTTLPNTFLVQFFEYLRLELFTDDYFRKILENKMLYLTVVGININLQKLNQVSELSHQELQEIKKILQERFKKNFSINEFLNQYKTCLINNYSQINFIGLGIDLTIKKGKRKKLEDLFVQPTFAIDDSHKEKIIESSNLEKPHSVELEQIFDFEQNLVILGDPGSGKSILTKYLTLKIIQKDSEIFNDRTILHSIPFRIELRNYHSYKKEFNGGLAKYLTQMLELDFGFSNITHEDVREILEKRKCLIIFDGLDEIFDIEDKLQIKNDIENFIAHHSLVQAIVTSRLIGYRDAAVKDEIALNLTINKFNDFQVETYIRNWYTVEEEDKNVREKEIEDLLSKKGLIDREIISNPLLLSLIVILYRNNLKVPESKLEIYQSCTKTLVDKWDFSKNLKINLPEDIYRRKDTIFADLAFWQYKELSTKEGKITYLKAKNTVAKTLKDKLKIVDEFTSDLFAEQFLEYAEKRSLYFENNFTHKTFLEYFTAFWIYSNIEKKHKKEERDELILRYVGSSYWHIVLELLMNLIDKDQADNEIIDDLIGFQLDKNTDSSKFFLQIFSSIKNVSIETYERIIQYAIINAINFHKKEGDEKPNTFYNERNSPFFILTGHYRDQTFKRSINLIFSKLLKSDIDKKYLLSFFLELQREVNLRDKDILEENDKKIIEEFEADIIPQNQLTYIIHLFLYKSSDFKKEPSKYVTNFVNLFGIQSFIEDTKSIFSNFAYFPFGVVSLRECVFHQDNKELLNFSTVIQKNKIELKEILSYIFDYPIFEADEEHYLRMVHNYNYIHDQHFLITLIAIVYSIRFQNRYFENKFDENKLLNHFNILKDKKLIQHLKFVINKKNSNRKVRSYLLEHFNIDAKLLKNR